MSGPLDDENDGGVFEGAGEPEAFDPAATGDAGTESDEFGENSVTWGSADPDFDALLRDRIGAVEPLPTPPYAFERVLLAGRRRRARKLWAGATAAALVVMAGTAGTTVALNANRPVGVSVAGSPSNTAVLTSSSAGVSAVPVPSASPSTSVSPSQSPSSAGSPSPSASTATIPQCHSTDPNPTAVVRPAGSGTKASLVLVLTNTSGHTCITEGYPGLQFAPSGGAPLQPVTETRLSSGGKHQLTVPPKGTVSSLVTYQTLAAGATAPTGCYTPSVYVLVIPPNEQNQLMGTIRGGPITVCGQGAVSLTPLVSGPNG